ncbi:MAG TPA: hypothetical protein VJ672_08000 [Gemmatimonadaceae bacterium]|nr:hypothetical protein [Gemmatimonadaceae bacterium]
MSSRDTFTVELHPADDSRDALLRAINAATEDRYSIVGEMAAPDNELLLLARSNERGQLVTLALRPSTWRGTRIHVLTVAPVRRAPEIGDYAEQERTSIAPPPPFAPPVTPEPPPEPISPELDAPMYATPQLRLEPSSHSLPDESEPEEPEQYGPEQYEPEQYEPARYEPTAFEPTAYESLPDETLPDETLPDESFRDEIAAGPMPDTTTASTFEPERDAELAEPLIVPVTVPDDIPERPISVAGRNRFDAADEIDEADDAWAAEMRGYSSWRGGSKMIIGAVAALMLFVTLVALAARSSDGTARSAAVFAGDTAITPAADSAPTVDSTAGSVDTSAAVAPVKTSALAAVAPAPDPRALTESPAPPSTTSRTASTAPTRSRPRTSPSRSRPVARATTESGGSIVPDPAAAFGVPPTRTTATAKRTEAPAKSCAALMAENARDAIPVCQRAALLGDAEAQAKIGLAHERGDGVRRSYGEAVAWFRKAAAQGHAWSENHLGWMYASGTGVERDDAQAVRWFRLAAEHGNAEAQYNLGFMYQRGRGVPKSSVNAAQWYRRAAQQGNQSAIRALKAMEG